MYFLISVATIPASIAAFIPKSPSSKTWQYSGATPNAFAAFKNVSGSGFGRVISSQVITD